MSTTIRVSEQTRDRLASLAASTGRPMTELVDAATDALERRIFFERLTSGYEVLRSDKTAWTEIQDERAAEASAIRDRSA